MVGIQEESNEGLNLGQWQSARFLCRMSNATVGLKEGGLERKNGKKGEEKEGRIERNGMRKIRERRGQRGIVVFSK